MTHKSRSMNFIYRNLVSVTALGTMLGSSITASAEADFNVLANDGTFRPTITFADFYSERIVTIPGKPSTHDKAATQKIAARIVANLGQFNLGEIVETMPLELKIGFFRFRASLGGDNSRPPTKPFDPKKRSATFYLYDSSYLPDGTLITRKTGSIVFAWNTRTLTVSVSNISPATLLTGISSAATGEAVPVSLTFGSVKGTRTAFAKHSSSARTVTFGSLSSSFELFFVSSVTVLGSADVTPPILSAIVPAKDVDSDGLVSFSGVVTDRPAGPDGVAPRLSISIFVNASTEPVAAVVNAPDEKGRRTFNVTDVPLKASINNLSIVAMDEDGNRTVLRKHVTTIAHF